MQSKPRQVMKAVASATVPERIGPVGSKFRQAIFFPHTLAGGVRDTNTSNVYIGAESTDNSQPYILANDATITLTLPDGVVLDLYDFYVDAVSNNDGVTVLFW